MRIQRFVAIYATVALITLLSLLIAPAVFGATTISTSISTGGNLTVTGNTTVSGNMTVSGNTTLGDTAADTITVTGKLAGGSLFFVKEVNAELSVQDSETAATAGASLLIQGATGSTTGAGGIVTLQGGTGGATSGTGGALNMYGGTGGTSGGNGGDTMVTGGDGTASAANGGDIYIRGGVKGAAGTNGGVLIGTANTNTITIGYISGTTTITGFTQHSAGTVSLPSISFVNDSNTGIYSPSASGEFAVAIDGTQRFAIGSSTQNVTITGSTSVSGTVVIAAGTVSAPSIALSGDTDTGIAAGAVANNLTLVAGGYSPFAIGSSTTLSTVTITGTATVSGNVRAGNGLVGNPAFAFDADPDTGIFRSAADELSLVAGGGTMISIGSSTKAITITGTTTLAGSTTVTTGPFTVPTGSVSAPSITFSGDTNTGISSVGGGDTVKIIAGGNSPLSVGSSSADLIGVNITGSTTISGNAGFSVGSVGAPSITFSSDTDTGFFASAANTLQLVAGGYNPIQLGTSSSTLENVTINGTTSVGTILAGNGTVGKPGHSFSGDTDTGMFRSAGDTLQFVAGGYAPIQIGTSSTLNNVTINGSTSLAGSTTITTGIFTVPAGGATVPSITFSGDTGTGIYSSGGNNIDFAANGNATMNITYTAGIATITVKGNLTSGSGINYGTTTLDIVGSTTNTGVCKQGTPSAANNVIIVDCDAAPAADYAERYPVAKDVDYGDIVVPGTRVVYTDSVQLPNADGSGFNTFPSHAIVELVKSNVPYQEPIAGIVSENWGDFTSAGNNINKKDNPKPVALVGRVPVKVTNEGGPIAIGDFLTTSSTPGHAMKATKAGHVIGMALGNFSGTKGKVMVQVLNTWWNPLIGENQASAATAQLQPTTSVSLEKIEKLVVQKNATIQGRLIVKGNARFDGQITVGKDTAGMVSLKTGQKTARVDFSAAYKKMPVVTVTPLGNPGGYYWVSDVNEKGFTVNVSKAPSSDLSFNWIALGSNAGLGEEEAKAKVETAAVGTAQ